MSDGSPWRTGAWTIEAGATTPLAWLTRLDAPEAAVVMARAALTPADYADLAGRADAAERLARRRLVKGMAATLAGCHPDAVRVGRSALGAPLILAPEGWHVSLAARWPLVALAVGRAAVGVDVERMGQAAPPDDAFTAAERARLAAAPPGEGLALWTAKEAHAKRTGRAGLYDACEIETAIEGGALVARSRDGASLCLRLRHGEAVATLAVAPASSG